ncbi:3-deoxy-D-manno-octulosonic acid transferase [Parasedimentitalea psychrophila]|uniref:3-deoxy-D-manno-octulosonic acid transferase n=1 Tax=Parasedimentitalea psychrophila TaxID=2997337 RepID=A0A9Y2P623_9RHOB|nr:glycosyltransferase N-terminal domain-containing protein [Parasedimentitalea psychrophila]WIY26969.1 glycosyltransferase N-terminal domain-containing protein [Parasedimentitalea psychrophila]
MGLPSPSTRAKPWRKSAAVDAWPPRPKGELIWAHATSTERFFALGDLGQRLKMMRPDLSLILTCEPDLTPLPTPDGYDPVIGELPADQPADVRSFLNHWRPDICLWTGGNLRPVLMRACSERGINALLIDIEADELPARGRRWLPDKSRKLLDKFSVILTPSPAAFAQLRRSSLAAEKITLTSRLRLSSTLPAYHEDELSRMRGNLGSRQVWLSAHTRMGEIDTIIGAHRNALRLLHRLLLVLSIEQYSDLDAARDALKDTGLRWADWEAGEDLDDNTQVLLTCDEDLGLWFRVAPLSLLAGTLEAGASGHNPMGAAALGSAILHGPHVGPHAPLYDRLTTAGAAQQVQGKDELAVQIIQLSAPDKAAEMAVAGWQVVTESAELTDLLLDKIQDMLDLREARHATP